MKSPIVFAASFILLIALLACNSSPDSNPIRIGATMSQSGAYSTQGIAAKNGYLLCEADVNRAGGVLGRPISFTIYDDGSRSATAIERYEHLISVDKVDLIMGPYGSTLTEAVAPVTEKHKMVHISPLAATSSIWEQGREYLFMVLPPAELFLAGLIEMAHEQNLTKVAIIQEDALFPKAAGQGAADLANEKGMHVVMHVTYPSGTTDFSDILAEAKASGVEVLGMAASALGDFIKVTEQLKSGNVNVKMFGTSGAVTQFQEALGADAEYIFGLSAWEPSLPNPGIDAFVDGYRASFGIEPSFHAAGAYASCQIFVESIKRAGNLNADDLREVLLNLEITTILSDFAVDERGYQIANRGLFIQWQDGEKVVVWPGDLATAPVRYPVPSWSSR